MAQLLDRIPLPKRVSMGLISAGVVVVLAGGMFATGRRRTFMRGPLIHAHRKLEFRCPACHARWQGEVSSSNDRCAAPDCHAKSLDTQAQESDSCIECHRPHPGRSFKPTCITSDCHESLIDGARTAKKGAPVVRDKYDHQVHDEKARTESDCERCHRATEGEVGYSLPTHKDCGQCHAHEAECPPVDQARKKRGKGCVRCHLDAKYDGRGDPPADPYAYVIFSHKPHDKYACTDCHKEIDAARRDPRQYVTTMEDCQRCHNSDTASGGKAPRDCMACHRAHHRYGRFTEAQTARGFVKYRSKWLTRDDAVKMFSDQTGRALSNLKRQDFETAGIHFELAKHIAEAMAESKWTDHPSARKMKARLIKIAKEFQESEQLAAEEEDPSAPALKQVAARPIKLRPATREAKQDYLSVTGSYARKIEKAFERLELETRLEAVDGSDKARYGGVTLRMEIYWSLWELRDAAEQDAISVVKAIFDRVSDVEEVMVEVQSKLGKEAEQEKWDRIVHITATREAHAKLNYQGLTLADAQAAFTFQYDKRIEKVTREEGE